MHAPLRRRLGSAAAAAAAADVTIVGAGIMGLNIAYQLRRRAPDLKVTVLERSKSLGVGSSGYSTGFQRALYAVDETTRLALDGMAAYKDWSTYLRDDAATAQFYETGALWMLGADPAENRAAQARLASFGVDADVLGADELGARFPLLSTEPTPEYDSEGDEVAFGGGELSALYEYGCGHLDPAACLEDLLVACRREGVDVRLGVGATSFVTTPDGSEVTGVALDGGHPTVHTSSVINAAGPWFNKLNATAGVTLSTTAVPIRVQVGHRHVPEEYLSLPFVGDGWGNPDVGGIYFMPRVANKQLLFGSIAPRFEQEEVNPDDYNQSLDPDVRSEFLGEAPLPRARNHRSANPSPAPPPPPVNQTRSTTASPASTRALT